MQRFAAKVRALVRRLIAAWHPQRADRDFDEEIRFHLERQTEKNRRAGMSSRQARRAAVRSFGSVSQVRAQHREARGLVWIESILRDLAFGTRGLRREPSTTLVALVALAVGIGATTSIFSSVSALVLRPLPLPDIGGLMLVWETDPARGSTRTLVSPANFRAWRDSGVLEPMAAYRPQRLVLTGDAEPERLFAWAVSPEYFAVLGVELAAGHGFGADGTSVDDVAVISHEFWHRRLGGEDTVLGTTLRVDGSDLTVIGVMPPGATYPLGADLWVPLVMDPAEWSRHAASSLRVFGRLPPGGTLERVQQRLDGLGASLAAQRAATSTQRGTRVQPLREEINFGTRRFVSFLMGAAGFLLALACATVANIQLARTTARRQEVAVRMALGAGRARIVRQLLTESVLLAAGAAVLGTLLAWYGNSLTRAAVPPQIARFVLAGLENLNIDGRVLAFTVLTTVSAAVLFGLAPALQASRADLNTSIKSKAVRGAGRPRVQALLVVTQVALSVVLLAGAALMVAGFRYLVDVDRGFDAENVLAMRLELSERTHVDADALRVFVDEGVRALGVLPGIATAAAAGGLPAVDRQAVARLEVEGAPLAVGDAGLRAGIQPVHGDFLAALKIPLLAGRWLTPTDNATSTPVAVVSASLVRVAWPDSDAVGKRIRLLDPETPGPWLTVVGVTGDVSRDWLTNETAQTIYRPMQQMPTRSLRLVARTADSPTALAGAAREQVWGIDPEQPITDSRSFAEILADLNSGIRLAARMMGVFAAIAFVLCAGGLYGLLAYTAAKRKHEIGVRMALGARRRDVVRLFVGAGLRWTALGLAFGLPAAWALGRLLSGFLLGVLQVRSGWFAILALVLLGVATAASYGPARRAAATDPVSTLRQD